jgi:hypothetical protein
VTQAAPGTWVGRRGPILLGPTQDRVARYLDRATSHGGVRIPTARIQAACRIERSEAYRITRQLRVLGLFGVRDDQGGARGGRYWWRTSVPHDTRGLDDQRHVVAWRRIRGWWRSREDRVTARLAQLRLALTFTPAGPRPAAAGGARSVAGGPTFADRIRRAGLDPGLARDWRLTP